MTPTARQIVVFRAYVLAGSQKVAAERLGISAATLRNTCGKVYGRLRVGGALEAASALGWLRLPQTEPEPFDYDAAAALAPGELVELFGR